MFTVHHAYGKMESSPSLEVMQPAELRALSRRRDGPDGVVLFGALGIHEVAALV